METINLKTSPTIADQQTVSLSWMTPGCHFSWMSEKGSGTQNAHLLS